MKIVRSARFVSSIRLVLSTGLLLGHAAAHATSFDCSKGRSIPEQLICHTGDLSKLDDQLGKLYWQARRRVDDPKAFRADSDRKWAWREANCRDEACLRTWYDGRIDELQRRVASLRTGRRGDLMPASPAPDAAGAAGASEPPVPALRALPLDVGRRALASESKGDGGSGNRGGNNGAEAGAETNAETSADSSADINARHVNATALARTVTSATPLQCTAAEPGLILHDQCATVLKQDGHSQYSPRPGDWFCGVATLAQSRAATPAQ